MTFKLFRYVLIYLFVTCAACVCWSKELPTQVSLKQSDVKRLLKGAKTPEEFEQLATYFEQRSKEFEQKAREEDKELDRLRNVTFRAKNYPILIDRARNYGDYDRSQVKKYSEGAIAFHRRAKAAADQTPTSGKQKE